MALSGFRNWFRKHHFTALHGADFSISPGTTLGVMGESGSGKSSLAQAVLGLIPFEGELSFGAHSWQGVPRQDKALRQRVQVVFQDPYGSLSPRMTSRKACGCTSRMCPNLRLKSAFWRPWPKWG
jgi:microcin C transport system ATP-binding protein